MRSIVGVRSAPDVVDSQRVKFAIYWKTALLILLISGLVSILIRFAAQQLIENRDDFSEYADILPGAPQEMVMKEGFTCENNPIKTNYYSSDYAVCTLLPESKTFSKIELIAYHNLIVESHFYVLNNALRYGDLMTSLGITHQNVYENDVFFFWNLFFVRVQTMPSKLHFVLRSVLIITFSDNHDPSLTSIFPDNPTHTISNK